LVIALVAGTAAIGHAQGNSTEIQSHLQNAHNALAAHDLNGASHEYIEILKLDPQNVEAHTGLGVALYGIGKPKEAATELHSALQIDPNQITAQMFLALSEASLGQCVEAIPLLTQYLDQAAEPELRRLLGLNLITCYESRSDQQHALSEAQALNRLYPDDPEVLFHLAEVYSSLLNTTVNELLRKHPESFRFHQIAGETLEAENNYSQAIKEYRKALEINPKALSIHYRIGKLLLLSVDGPEAGAQALAEFQKELDINSADEASEYQIGEILFKDHHNEEARQNFLHAIELSPDFAEAHVGLAQVELEDHQPAMAVKELERAIQLQPADPAAHYALMMAYRDLGDRGLATQELTIFQSLKNKEDNDFRSRLQALLSDGGSAQDKQ
jgi:tetratricopeptide (TPR) repeat protein